MAKQLNEMSIDELVAEWEAWELVINAPKGPDSPSNSARDGAFRICEEVEAWLARRKQEDKTDADNG